MAKIYGVVETTKLTGEFCLNFKADVDIENGWVVAKGDLAEGESEVYTAVEPTAADEVYLVANPAWNYCDCTAEQKNEESYINAAGKVFRVYTMKKDNKFAVTDYSIADSDKIAVGDYITVNGTAGADAYMLKDAGKTAPAANGFVGKVTEIRNNGFQYAAGSAGTISVGNRMIVVEVISNEKV